MEYGLYPYEPRIRFPHVLLMKNKIVLTHDCNVGHHRKQRIKVTKFSNTSCSFAKEWWNDYASQWVEFPHHEDHALVYSFEEMRIISDLFRRIENLKVLEE